MKRLSAHTFFSSISTFFCAGLQYMCAVENSPPWIIGKNCLKMNAYGMWYSYKMVKVKSTIINFSFSNFFYPNLLRIIVSACIFYMFKRSWRKNKHDLLFYLLLLVETYFFLKNSSVGIWRIYIRQTSPRVNFILPFGDAFWQ